MEYFLASNVGSLGSKANSLLLKVCSISSFMVSTHAKSLYCTLPDILVHFFIKLISPILSEIGSSLKLSISSLRSVRKFAPSNLFIVTNPALKGDCSNV